jgi:hypothetical protein
MHINDVYALRGLLARVAAGDSVDLRTLTALQDAVQEEVSEFEQRLELQALAEEARQGEMA